MFVREIFQRPAPPVISFRRFAPYRTSHLRIVKECLHCAVPYCSRYPCRRKSPMSVRLSSLQDLTQM